MDNQSDRNKSPSSLLPRLALAGISATVAQTVCQPIETVKIRMQLRVNGVTNSPYSGYNGGMLHAARYLVQNEGWLGLWKGMAPSALREMSYSSIRFGLFVPIQSVLEHTSKRSTSATTIPTPMPTPTPMWKRFLAGGLSGGIGAAIANPTDLLKARMQADTAPGWCSGRSTKAQPKRMLIHISDIYNTKGIRGFWLGVGTTVSRAVVLGAANLGTYSTAKSLLISDGGLDDGVFTHFCASTVAGFAIAITTAPIDFARSRLMVQQTHKPLTVVPPTSHSQQQPQQQPQQHYRNGLHVMRHTISTEGISALYRGFFAQWARCAPYTVLQFIVWEQLCKAMGVRTV